MMRTMRLVLAAMVVIGGGAAADEEGSWIQLFDGESLEGWTPKLVGHPLGEDPLETFRVEDGYLTVSYDNYESFNRDFGHLFYKDSFSHYLLRVEYRFIGEQVPGGPGWAFRNNGIMLHGQDPATMGVDQHFPVSIEVQLLGGDGERTRPTANVCTPGTHIVMNGDLITQHCTNSSSETYHGDQWVTVEIEVRGNAVIRHRIDGEVVLEYTEPQLDPDDRDGALLVRDGEVMLHEGTISIQAESHPTQFRKIELLVLEE